MAELELAVKYQTRYMRAVYFLVLLLFPFWSIVAPGLLACTLPFVISFSHQIAPQWTALYLFGLTGMLFGGLGLSAIAEDTRIRISKNGLSFPPLLMPLLKFQRDYSWNDLAVADFDGDQEDRSHKLRLSFKSGRAIALDLNRLKPSELEQVLMSVELWGATCERTPSLITYQASVQNQNRGMEKLGYTEMWEEELGRRFHATSFVPLEPGAQLQNKKYNVVRQLAFGGFSAIYLSQRNNSDLVVLKEAVVPTDGDTAAIEAAQKHLKRESEMLARLSHEHIARVVDNFVEDDRNYLVLEYISGQDLRQLTRQNGPQDPAQVVRWGVQLATVLEFLHSQQPPIIHRDFTPDNIVRRNDDDLVVIDFGASNEFIGNATGTMVGKQSFIAPEQLRGKASPSSDLYAFGGTLYFLMTARDPKPLAPSELKSVLPGIDSELNELVLELTAFEDADRPASATVVVSRLRKILVGMEGSGSSPLIEGSAGASSLSKLKSESDA